jgi:hypothetical protein
VGNHRGLAREAQGKPPEAIMGRSYEAIRTRDLDTLFGYFGLEVEAALVEAHRGQITERFRAEVGEIVRLCKRLRERERFTIVREALRLAYESAVLLHHAHGAGR